MKMNYIKLVNSFWHVDLEHSFSANATRLYFGLLNMANRIGWKNPFGATNQQLAALIQCDEKTLIKCRKVLVKSGLISVKRGCKNTPNSIALNAIHWNISSEYSSESSSVSSCESSSHLKTKTKTKRIYIAQIEEVFKIYPRRVGKKAAINRIREAMHDHGYELILEKTKAYAKAREGQPIEFTPHPATWFNQGRYLDEPDTWAVTGSQSGSSTMSVWEAQKQLTLVEAEMKQIKETHAYPSPGGGYSWGGVDQKHKDAFRTLRDRSKVLKPIAMGL
jgi:hypothetical protein